MHLKVKKKKEYCIKIQIKIVPLTVIYLQCLFVAKLCLLNRIHLVIFFAEIPFSDDFLEYISLSVFKIILGDNLIFHWLILISAPIKVFFIFF